MVSQAGSNPDAVDVTAQAGTRSVWEWFWRGQALAAARQSHRSHALRRERVRRALLATELADRQLASDEPLRAGSSLPLVLSLYREATFWTLLAEGAQAPAANLRSVFGAAEPAVVLTGLAPDELAAVRVALVDKSFVETADDRPELQRRDAELAQQFVRGLQSRWDTTDRVANALTQRWLRTGLTVIIALSGLFVAMTYVQSWWQGPDLALGKPWRTSTHEFDCHPKDGECGGVKTNIFFHTIEEASPWIEIDLGSAEKFGRIQVANRDDCCLDRAVPLIAEVSTDREHWKTVGREPDSFRHWDATFTPLTARYVRLRVDRLSILHLGRVSVRAR